MTQPDKNTPPSAVNKDSLGAFAARTREDWEAEQREAAAAQWAESVRQMQKLLGNVPIIGDLIEIFTGIEDGDLNDFGTAFNRWKNFWGDGIKGLLDAVMDFFEPVKEFVDGFGDVGKAIDDAVQGGVKFITEGVAFVGGGIAATLGAIGQGISEGLKATQGVFDELGKAVFGTVTAIGEGVQGAVDGFGLGLQHLWNTLTGTTAKADTAISNNTLTNIAVYEGYFGIGNATGEVAQVQETVATIKTEIFRGYTLQSLTFNADMTKQLIQVVGSPTGGTFTLSYGGQSTSAISYSASASTIQTALRALSTVGNSVTVTAVPSGYPYAAAGANAFIATFSGVTSPAPTAITVSYSLTGGSSPYVNSTALWTPPWTSSNAPKEFFLITVGSGQGGGAGTGRSWNAFQNVPGGNGGLPAGYSAIELDATIFNPNYPIPYIIPAGGLGSTSSVNGNAGAEALFFGYPGAAAFASFIGRNYISSLLGFYTVNESAPGKGGNGGWGYVADSPTGPFRGGTDGEAGGSNPLANGGAGGAGGAGSNLGPDAASNTSGIVASVGTTPGKGGNGQDAVLTGKSRAGGGGGGGGGGSYYGAGVITQNKAGGLGGNGGFPGGGGGGGGGAFFWDFNSNNTTAILPGNGGNGGNGVILLLWK